MYYDSSCLTNQNLATKGATNKSTFDKTNERK